MNLLTEHARELLGMPPEWNAYKYEAIGHTADQKECKLIRVDGAVAPLKTRGKYKGHPHWDKLDKETEKTAFFTPSEHDEWLRQWEQKTGKCARCVGRGEKMVGWSAANGVSYKPCDKCGATGNAPDLSQATNKGDGVYRT
jgi:hypothetical protein